MLPRPMRLRLRRLETASELLPDSDLKCGERTLFDDLVVGKVDDAEDKCSNVLKVSSGSLQASKQLISTVKLTSLPSQVTSLSLSFNSITKFPSITAKGLTELYLGNTPIASFDDLSVPSSVKKLKIDQTKIKSFAGATLPESLESLDFTITEISSLAGLSAPNLKELIAYPGSLQELAKVSLPPRLETMLVSRHKITAVYGVVFPSSLKTLDLSGNPITHFEISTSDLKLFKSMGKSFSVDFNQKSCKNSLAEPQTVGGVTVCVLSDEDWHALYTGSGSISSSTKRTSTNTDATDDKGTKGDSTAPSSTANSATGSWNGNGNAGGTQRTASSSSRAAASSWHNATGSDSSRSKTPSERPSSTSRGHSSKTFIIVTAVAAVLVVALIVVICVVCVKRRRRRDEADHPNRQPSPTDSVAEYYLVPKEKGPEKTQTRTMATSTGTVVTSVVPPGNKPRATRTSKPSRDQEHVLLSDPELVAIRLPSRLIEQHEKIGRGAFGEVFKGTLEGQTVAIKRLSEEVAAAIGGDGETRVLQSFVAEARLNAQLQHPNLVTLIGVTWESSCLATSLGMVYEFMSRGDLRQVLLDFKQSGRRRGFDQEKVQIALDVANGLQFLHHQRPKVLHRDLKSRNILLNDRMQAKLSDFGVSRRATEQTLTFTAGMGTILWMAPEVLMGQRYNEKADIFSFGVVLSELDTHLLPYSKSTDDANANANGSSPHHPSSGHHEFEFAILQQVAFGKRRVGFTYSSREDAVVALANACVSVDPNDRPTASEVAFELDLILKQLRSF